MQIASFTATSTNKKTKLRITENFATLLILSQLQTNHTPLSLDGTKITMFIESKNKNIMLANNVDASSILTYQKHRDDLATILGAENQYHVLKVVKEGNFNLLPGDALVLEISGLRENQELQFFLTRTLYDGFELVEYEKKTILAGERVRKFEVKDTEFILFTPSRQPLNAGYKFTFEYDDETGTTKQVERSFAELFFEVLESYEKNENDTLKISEESPLLIPVFGFKSFSVECDSKQPHDLLFINNLETNYFNETVEETFKDVVNTMKDKGIINLPSLNQKGLNLGNLKTGGYKGPKVPIKVFK